MTAAEQLRAMRPQGGYQLIMADPPWQFSNYSAKGHKKSAQAHYECRDLDWIKSLPVGELADQSGCLLMLWATNPMLPQAMDVMAAWGFEYKTAAAWVKLTKHGKLAFGTGYVLRSAHEPILFGKIGRVSTTRSTRSVVMAQAREHSRKPDEAFEAAVNLMPHARRIELFSRESRDGWDTWGDEATKFDAKANGDDGDHHVAGRDAGVREGPERVQAQDDAGRALSGLGEVARVAAGQTGIADT